MKRREFIILTGVGATSAGVLSACGHPENRLIPALIPDEEYVPGVEYWKATACAMCAAGCGILVRTREHKANKIEGNPLHPINRGALCARGQAGLQLLYNPDRIRGPVKRTGERGSASFEEISWDEAIKMLADRLREIKAEGRADNVVFATAEPGGVTQFAARLFMNGYGSHLIVAQDAPAEAENSYETSLGRAAAPIFDIANATYLLSFGARFLETWLSPVKYSLAYGEFRRTPARARGKFVHVEPRMSLTAANADEWIPAAHGSEGLLALAIAQVVIREGLIKNAPVPRLNVALDQYAPEKTAGITDVAAEKVIRIAREFAASERPIAIGGGAAQSTTNGHENMRAVNFLNTLVGNLNKAGGLLLPDADYYDPFGFVLKDSPVLMGSIDSQSLNIARALLIHNANPVYSSPHLVDEINKVPFIASFSSFMDETTRLADLILPDHSYLERWDLTAKPLGGSQVAVTFAQPVVKPEFNTRQTADILIALNRELGAEPTPYESAEDMVKQAASKLNGTGLPTDGDPKARINTLFERGVWAGDLKGITYILERDESAINLSPVEAQDDGKAEFPLALITYVHAALGEQANLPWLQELPDAMTSVMWGSWVEINPKTAAALGIKDGDTVEVQTPQGAARAPAIIYPAIRPDVIAMPLGQGHTALGRYASGRGTNAATLNSFISDETYSGPKTIRARVIKADDGSKLARFGTGLPLHAETKR